VTSLYIHVPFCRSKCPYCDFFSVAGQEDVLRTYPEKLCRHLEIAERWGWRGPLDSIFFGGGTPSLLTPEEIGRVLDSATRAFGVADGAEISLEANPGTLSLSALCGFRSAGINRISIGVQSLNPGNLKLLGRSHSPADARRAFTMARKAGFENISCDLIFSLPGQDLCDLRTEVEEIIALGPEHLSCYGLTVEDGTPFHHLHLEGGLALPDEASGAEHFSSLHHWLDDAGYSHYEISNYARPGLECRHNLGYWNRENYLGIGAGAHSFCGKGWGSRRAVPGDLDIFAADLAAGADPSVMLERFDRRGAMAETLYLGLRTGKGVENEAFRKRFGVGVAEAFPQAVAHAADRLSLREGRWRFDLEGWLLYDHLITPFL
jgi:oxygen-independent coproporphyrinogen III oxidase